MMNKIDGINAFFSDTIDKYIIVCIILTYKVHLMGTLTNNTLRFDLIHLPAVRKAEYVQKQSCKSGAKDKKGFEYIICESITPL